MNPTVLLGSVASLLGIGGSLANQAVAIHRNMNPPQQQSGATTNTQCPVGSRLVVLIKPDGSRQLYCMQQDQAKQ
jgi:hypothetical protein